MIRRAAITVALSLLTACGGGGGAGGANVTPVATTPASTTGTAQVQLIIPSVGPTWAHRRTAIRGRLPLYISNGTNSVAIAINGTFLKASTIQYVCNLAAPSGEVCTLTIPAPVGNDTFLIELGDQNGNLLSQGSVNATINPSQVTVLHLTFYGLPSRVALQLDTPNPPVGQNAILQLTATAYDASGSQIIGDDYLRPINVSDDDKSGQVLISSSQFRNPSDSITVTYSGKLIANVAFTVTAPVSTGNSPATLAPNPYRSSPTAYYTYHVARGADGNVWFNECQGNTGPCKIGKVSPSGQVTESPDLRYVQDLTAGPDGNVWFTENTFPYVGKITPNMQITEYQSKTLGSNEAYYAGPIVAGPDGNLWFMELQDLAQMSITGQILQRIPVTGANWCPSAIVGADRNFWIAGIGTIIRVTPTGSVASFPIGTVSGILMSNLVLAPDANIYFRYMNGLKKIATDGTIADVSPTPATLHIGPPFSVGPDKSLWGFGGATDVYATPSNGAMSMTLNTYALTVYAGGPNDEGTANLTAAWGADGNLWIPTGGSVTRFRYDP